MICQRIGVCATGCKLWNEMRWPPAHLPPAPHPDPPNKRQLRSLQEEDDAALQTAFLLAARAGEGFWGVANMLSGLVQSETGTLSRVTKELASFGFTADHPCHPRFNVTCIIDRFVNLHLPVLDRDGDGFSTTSHRGLRGSNWRGADCNDADVAVYPGRKVASANTGVDADHDCNGIVGGNASGSYEDLLCSGTPRRGMIHIGDSATAHFHLPPAWVTRDGWNLHNLLPNAVDELDWPACAWGTGYRNTSRCPYAHVLNASARPARLSIAERLRDRNRCNHRDFQNIGVNGARMTAVRPLVESVARSPATDHPALVVLSLIGNDVCNGHPGTTHMTKPEDFRKDATEALTALQSKLPAGSFVLLVGLVDGRVLWEAMHAKQHPLGATYPDVYGYLSCNEANPCNGWLTSNATLRNLTTAWANSLNDVLESITAAASFAQFEVGFFRPDLRALFDEYVRETGGDPGEDLVEPSDGFHPSQLANELLADQVWTFLEARYPHAIGALNPHNAEIMARFGDQGGW